MSKPCISKGKLVPKIAFDLEVIVRDKDGKVIMHKKGVSHSYLENFLRILRCLFTGIDETLTNRDGNSVTITKSDLQNLESLAPEGTIDYGIVASNEDNVIDCGMYTITGIILHGDEDNKLHYYDTGASNVTCQGDECSWYWNRDMKNFGAVDITIKTIAVYVKIGTSYFLIFATDVSDALGSDVTVPSGATVTWHVKMKIPCKP